MQKQFQTSSIQHRMAVDSFFRIGYFYHAEGDLESASAYYRKSIQSAPNAEAHTFLGWIYALQGKLNSAIRECRKATTLNPEFGNAWNDMGVYCMEKGDFDRAVKYLSSACKARNYDQPEYPHYNLARLYLEKDMVLLATIALKKALQINPRFRTAKKLLLEVERSIH